MFTELCYGKVKPLHVKYVVCIGLRCGDVIKTKNCLKGCLSLRDERRYVVNELRLDTFL